MLRLAILLLGLLLAAACAPPRAQTPAGAPAAERPQRIVSLDYCADQYVLKLVEPDRIVAVSPYATSDFSYMRDAAQGLATVRPTAEDVLLLKPDLVVRSYGGGPNAPAFFERAGVPVLTVGWAGDMDAVMANVATLADGLGVPERGAALVARMQARLDALRTNSTGKRALYVTPGGVTTGPGSLIHEMLEAAGLENFETTPGWRPIPLEKLAYDRPDVVAAAFFGSTAAHDHGWSAARHPLMREVIASRQTVPLNGAWTACGGWFVLDAVEMLADGAGG